MRWLVAVVVSLVLPATALGGEQRFAPIRAEQQFVVPAGITSVRIVAVGARGGGTMGGLGGTASADLSVTPGATLYVEVGEAGRNTGARPFNGGGTGGFDNGSAGDGGGASDVRTVARTTANTLASRLVVAGGGGGATSGDLYPGGNGGGTTGGTGSGGTRGGTQSTGGAGGVGGDGGDGAGGGGGGYYGGAGGGVGYYGGGGGSGYFGPGTTSTRFGTGAASDPPSVTISWPDPAGTTPPDPVSTPTPTPTPQPSPSPGPAPTPAPAPANVVSPTVPNTKLGRHPATRITTRRTKVRVTFTFTASTPNATFRCKLDAGRETACDPGRHYDVRPGFHQFTVVAILTGVRDPTPVRFTFTVRKARRTRPRSHR